MLGAVLVLAVGWLAVDRLLEVRRARGALLAEAAALRAEAAQARAIVGRWRAAGPQVAGPQRARPLEDGAPGGTAEAETWTAERAAGAVVEAARAERVVLELIRPWTGEEAAATRVSVRLRGAGPALVAVVRRLEAAGARPEGVRLRGRGGAAEAEIEAVFPAPVAVAGSDPGPAPPPAGDVSVADIAARVDAVLAAAEVFLATRTNPGAAAKTARPRAEIADPFAPPTASLASLAAPPPPPLPISYAGAIIAGSRAVAYFRLPGGQRLSIERGGTFGEYRLEEVTSETVAFRKPATRGPDGRFVLRRGAPAGP